MPPTAGSHHGQRLQVGANSTVNIRWIPDHLIERIGLFLPARSLLHLFACDHTLQQVLRPLVAWRHCEHLIGMSNTRPQTADDYRHTISAAQPCRPRDRLNIFRMLARTLPCCVGEDERREAASALAEAAAQAGGDFGAARVTTDILRCLGYRQAHRSTPWLADMEASLSAYMQGEPVEKRAPLMGDYLVAVRQLPPPQREPGYWERTLAYFPAKDAAATLKAVTSWLFPPRDSHKCSVAFQSLLGMAQRLAAPDGRPSPWQATALLALLDTISDQRYLGADRPGAWAAIHGAALKLPSEAKSGMLCGLARQLYACSAGRDNLCRHWDQLLEAADDLPAPALANVLSELVRAFDCPVWSEGGATSDEESEEDASDGGYFVYGDPFMPSKMQSGDDAAQRLVSERCTQLLDRLDTLPPSMRGNVLAVVDSMLTSRQGYWSTVRHRALKKRLIVSQAALEETTAGHGGPAPSVRTALPSAH